MVQSLRYCPESMPAVDAVVESPMPSLEFTEISQISSKPLLEFTETSQISYRPSVDEINESDHARQCTACAHVCKETIESMNQTRTHENRFERRRNVFGRHGKDIVNRVHMFISEMKRKLEGTCANALFDSPNKLIALALGISTRTVTRISQTEETPQPERITQNRKRMRMVSVRRNGPQWGEVVKQAIHQKLRDELDITMTELHGHLCSTYEDFDLSRATLHRLVRGLGFSYRKVKRQIYIFKDLHWWREGKNTSEVRERTINWLGSVSSALADAWYREARREETEAWEKHIDREEESTDTTESSLSTESDDSVESLSSDSSYPYAE
ncbi:unnamed protein product [Cylicocyclus nassatus]|uniref:Uncharacterized protein n=1 Tax=Cylicocyclus nassatus TaxID=53992 RepID=A0AA36GHE7_CYLNA|nr:unnamed protein product [Cylicocyclus nassatus]